MISLKTLGDKKNKITWDFENLIQWFRVELSYTSNAIEGSTFTRAETAVLLNDDITIGGKTFKEHLKIKNHAKAFDYIIQLCKSIKISEITEEHILKIHEYILHDISNAGVYRRVPVPIVGSVVVMPNYQKVPQLMAEFVSAIITSKAYVIDLALYAHLEFVTIHPFIDGNGRTARLLMNLILLIGGYPPLNVYKEERLDYINSIEKYQLTNDLSAYNAFMYKAYDQTLDFCLETSR